MMKVPLSWNGFDRMLQKLDATFVPPQNGALPDLGRGLYGPSLFYPATRRVRHHARVQSLDRRSARCGRLADRAGARDVARRTDAQLALARGAAPDQRRSVELVVHADLGGVDAVEFVLRAEVKVRQEQPAAAGAARREAGVEAEVEIRRPPGLPSCSGCGRSGRHSSRRIPLRHAQARPASGRTTSRRRRSHRERGRKPVGPCSEPAWPSVFNNGSKGWEAPSRLRLTGTAY